MRRNKTGIFCAGLVFCAYKLQITVHLYTIKRYAENAFGESVLGTVGLNWKELGLRYRRATGKVQPGSIALFRGAALHTPEALPEIIGTLMCDGHTCVPISELVLEG